MTRVGFTLIGGGTGTGGYNYLLNLLGVIARHQSSRLQPVLFLGTDVDAGTAEPFRSVPGLEIEKSAAFDRSRRTRSLIRAVVHGADRATLGAFAARSIDVLFESAQFHGARIGFPAVAWIPDFQHRLLPRMFTLAGWLRREIGLRAQMAAGRTIMLSSEDSRQACERLYPQTIGRTRTVRFAVPPGSAPSSGRARAVADGYGLPERFFFMPNQWSRHKNHLLVIDALAILRRRGFPVCIAASGKQADERHPGHFDDVRRRIAEAGVGDSLRLLGLVPYPHLAALMRSSVALLNPSLFEGWSTPVEEARALGVRMLLSDLAVHREQAGENAIYFDRHSAESLADVLQAFVPVDAADAELRAEAARRDAEQRVERFASDFADLVEDCVAGRIGR